ncbi:MAG: SLBB domain-containing protein [Actinomycetota bacterium]|nr:SLBB domain-containing protein [Actinomycetota bacterium]
MLSEDSLLLADEPVETFSDYLAAGGGEGLSRALSMEPGQVVAQIARSGLRGRGGAGFPTGRKWAAVVEAAGTGPVHLVCNAAEGEPATYKDRVLMARNPWQLLEGVLIARHATGAVGCFVGVKERFSHECRRLVEARDAMAAAGWMDADDVRLVFGPDEYLFGEESAMLEVIEGKLPLPRILPPYMAGLFATMQDPNPTVVNNCETLSHVTHILAKGADWFRRRGTSEAPGTMLFTVVGDVASPGVYELPLGAPMRLLIEEIAGASDVKAIYAGTSNAVVMPGLLDLPMDFDSFTEAGIGLGSGGFVVYDQSRCIVQVTATLTRFLAVESCGQCLACKLGNSEISELLDKLVRGEGSAGDLEAIAKRCRIVTDGNRCYLPVGTQLLVGSTVDAFADEFAARVGTATPPEVFVPVPKLERIDEQTGEVFFDADYERKRPDWSYAPQ